MANDQKHLLLIREALRLALARIFGRSRPQHSTPLPIFGRLPRGNAERTPYRNRREPALAFACTTPFTRDVQSPIATKHSRWKFARLRPRRSVPNCLATCSALPQFRFWHFSDVEPARSKVRFRIPFGRRRELTPRHYLSRPVSASHIFRPQRDTHLLATAAYRWPQRSSHGSRGHTQSRSLPSRIGPPHMTRPRRHLLWSSE